MFESFFERRKEPCMEAPKGVSFFPSTSCPHFSMPFFHSLTQNKHKTFYRGLSFFFVPIFTASNTSKMSTRRSRRSKRQSCEGGESSIVTSAREASHRQKIVKKSEKAFCSICMEDPSDDCGSINGCNHTFCFPCISRWSARENTCPLCRIRFTSIERQNIQGNIDRIATVENRNQVDFDTANDNDFNSITHVTEDINSILNMVENLYPGRTNGELRYLHHQLQFETPVEITGPPHVFDVRPDAISISAEDEGIGSELDNGSLDGRSYNLGRLNDADPVSAEDEEDDNGSLDDNSDYLLSERSDTRFEPPIGNFQIPQPHSITPVPHAQAVQSPLPVNQILPTPFSAFVSSHRHAPGTEYVPSIQNGYQATFTPSVAQTVYCTAPVPSNPQNTYYVHPPSVFPSNPQSQHVAFPNSNTFAPSLEPLHAFSHNASYVTHVNAPGHTATFIPGYHAAQAPSNPQNAYYTPLPSVFPSTTQLHCMEIPNPSTFAPAVQPSHFSTYNTSDMPPVIAPRSTPGHTTTLVPASASQYGPNYEQSYYF